MIMGLGEVVGQKEGEQGMLRRQCSHVCSTVGWYDIMQQDMSRLGFLSKFLKIRKLQSSESSELDLPWQRLSHHGNPRWCVSIGILHNESKCGWGIDHTVYQQKGKPRGDATPRILHRILLWYPYGITDVFYARCVMQGIIGKVMIYCIWLPYLYASLNSESEVRNIDYVTIIRGFTPGEQPPDSRQSTLMDHWRRTIELGRC